MFYQNQSRVLEVDFNLNFPLAMDSFALIDVDHKTFCDEQQKNQVFINNKFLTLLSIRRLTVCGFLSIETKAAMAC